MWFPFRVVDTNFCPNQSQLGFTVMFKSRVRIRVPGQPQIGTQFRLFWTRFSFRSGTG
ncbi:hypothetical protein Hanom_Chr09g00844911 [Helianthus anomalus]